MLLRTRVGLMAAGAVAGMLLGMGAWRVLPASYTSEAVLMLEPAKLPQASLADTVSPDEALNLIRNQVTTRNVLSIVIREFGLYPHTGRVSTKESLISRMRKSVRMERDGALTRVAFTYSDRVTAQRVTEDLSSRVIDWFKSKQSNRDFVVVQHFEWSAGDALDSWKKADIQIHRISPQDPRFDAATLDRSLFQADYETEQRKLTEARGLQETDQRGTGAAMTILDPASLPEAPDVPLTEVALFSLGAGLAAGFLASLRPRPRRRLLATA